MAEQQLAQARHPARLRALRARELRIERPIRCAKRIRRRAASSRRSRCRTRDCCCVGRHGVGKTHLAVAILKDVIRTKGARGYFYETRELLKLVRDTYNNGGDATEMDVLRPVLDADLLVLDDLGAEKTSEWVQETLGLVVNTRYSERRPTIFTTNLVDSPNPEDLNSMIVRIGARTRSRLFEMCEWVEMDGADTRQVGVHPTPEALARYNRESPESDQNRRPGGFPDKARGMARAGLRARGAADVNWAGGKGGSR